MSNENIKRTQGSVRELGYELILGGRSGATLSPEGRWVYGKAGCGLADIKEDGSLRINYSFGYVEVLDEQLDLMDRAKEAGIPFTVANVGKTREEVEGRIGLLESCLKRLGEIRVEEIKTSIETYEQRLDAKIDKAYELTMLSNSFLFENVSPGEVDAIRIGFRERAKRDGLPVPQIWYNRKTNSIMTEKVVEARE